MSVYSTDSNASACRLTMSRSNNNNPLYTSQPWFPIINIADPSLPKRKPMPYLSFQTDPMEDPQTP